MLGPTSVRMGLRPAHDRGGDTRSKWRLQVLWVTLDSLPAAVYTFATRRATLINSFLVQATGAIAGLEEEGLGPGQGQVQVSSCCSA